MSAVEVDIKLNYRIAWRVYGLSEWNQMHKRNIWLYISMKQVEGKLFLYIFFLFF